MTNALAARFALRSLVARVGLLAVCSLPLAACDTEQPNAADDGALRLVELPEGGTCVPLVAGQHIDAGTVCVTIDATVDTSAQCGEGATGALQVVYATHDGWELVQTHLAYGDELADIPTNKKGNPKIGLFPLASGDITGATEQGFAIPLCELGLDSADGECDPIDAYLAAHAVVRRPNGEDSFETQTAWGSGEELNGQGSWAQMFSVELSCHSCKGNEGDEGGDKGPDPLASFDDDFDGDLSGWEIYNPAAASVSIADGAMVMEPGASTQWYGTDEAVQVSKAMTGDFMVTTRMRVTNLEGGSTAEGGPYRIGGLMLRDAAGGPNTVHMGIGNMNSPSVSAMTKSTDDGVSEVHTAFWMGQDEAEMRLCRVGADVRALIRVPGQSWIVINEFERADLPATLAAGPVAYAGTADADLRAAVDFVRFHSASSLADCMMD